MWFNGRIGSTDEFSIGRLCPKTAGVLWQFSVSCPGIDNLTIQALNYRIIVFKSLVPLSTEYRTTKRYDQGLLTWIQWRADPVGNDSRVSLSKK